MDLSASSQPAADVHLHNLLNMSGQLGVLVVSERGVIIESHGDFLNDSVTGNTILKLLRTAFDIRLPESDCRAKRLCLYFQDHVIVSTVSNRRVYIIKLPLDDDSGSLSD